MIEKLDESHDVDSFDCGKKPLDDFLKRHALSNQKASSSQTYVFDRGDGRVVGYYSLAFGAIAHEGAPDRMSKGLARHPVPVMLLARLAVDGSEQRSGIGKAMLRDAVLNTIKASDIAGLRALMVEAKDDEAKKWYKKFDFNSDPENPFCLFLLMKDLRTFADRSGYGLATGT